MSLNYVTFNQDYSCLAVGAWRATPRPLSPGLTLYIGTSKGFRIYQTDPFSQIIENDQGHISIIEQLFSTTLVALVLSPRRLRIVNTKVRFYIMKWIGHP